MNNMEEQLWSYIDGTCTAEERKQISALIADDKVWALKYQELQKLNKEFSVMDLDEPSMAFTYNVMEAIRTEQAMVPLKAGINKRIIWGIGAFFAFTILALLVYTIAHISWSATSGSVNTPVTFKIPDIRNYITKPVMEVFFFFDVVLALFLSDAYLRKKRALKHE